MFGQEGVPGDLVFQQRLNDVIELVSWPFEFLPSAQKWKHDITNIDAFPLELRVLRPLVVGFDEGTQG